ncbi:MAG: methyltransferase domain-containing protein, partial [Candidatus Sumerlaeota bacterium]|nr:methyltransferase domain-containing protein [Candidatus Sumerlaeota bacterium]
MKNAARDCLKRVQDAYSGPEADLWKLIMGEHIHIGGYESSMDLAERSGVGEGMQGVDLCCALGAGMRLLIRAHGVQSMRGVDATARMIEWGRALCAAEGMGDRTEFLLADVCESGLPSESADFVWGEDAW